MVKKLLDEIVKVNGLKIISFDIFDTLLFRTARYPKDVFKIMYESSPILFPEYTEAEDWVNVRQLAEQQARKEKNRISGHYEVKLEEIYNYIPPIYKEKERIYQLELETEKQVCFLNEEIYELLKYVKNHLEVKIILVSDMYLKSNEILDILESNGFDERLINKIYVSCEYEKSKRKVELFKYILAEQDIEPQEMFHIGDNYYSDVSVPNLLEIPHFHYNVISEAMYKYPFLQVENDAYGEMCEKIYSLRIMAGSKNRDNNFWFQLGAMIVGPFLTYAVEWTIDQAEENSIQRIRPLMREGKFLTKLIKRALQERKSDISVEPLYISRLAVFTALFENITDKEIKYLFETHNMTLCDVFKLLKIEDLGVKYKNYLNEKILSLQMKKNGEISIYDEILDFLTSRKTCEEIRKRNRGSAERFEKYLEQVKLTEGGITVDIGWRGNMQNAISTLLAEKGYDSHIIHLLFVSKPDTYYNLFDNCDIRGFVGNFGSAKKEILASFARFYEMFLLCDEGTTIGYETEKDVVVPVLKYIEYPQWQIEAMTKLQEGISTYQECYFELARKKAHIRKWEKSNICTHHIMERLCCFPLKEEAEIMKNLLYDQNFGADSFSPIIGEDILHSFLSEPIERHYAQFHGVSIFWNSGLNVLKDPLFYHKQFLYLDRKYMALSILLNAQGAIKIACRENKKVILVGAGINLSLYLKYIIAMGMYSKIEAIVDNDRTIQGSEIFGIKIYPVESRFETDLYLCTTNNKVFYDSLFEQIRSFTKDSMKFMGYYSQLE